MKYIDCPHCRKPNRIESTVCGWCLRSVSPNLYRKFAFVIGVLALLMLGYLAVTI